MPTPVSAARQCLTDEAALALDDAVAVARRRSHSQTTSLHAVSALLALPSSILRESCARAGSSAYSPRLQFRALELSVGVSLDRLPTAKGCGGADEPPPVANSLMAAIKRSQANQRRHPDTFHLYQQIQLQQNQSSISCVKVELKHFILSILDDPIVSRVFGEAGFRSNDIKLAVLHPPPISRFPRSRCPPLFLCNFPFAGFESGDENSRRIGEVFAKKKGKNPLLVGVCANDALSSFTEGLQRGKRGLLPAEIDGLGLICVEKEISEFVGEGRSKEMMDLKFKEVTELLGNCSGPGVVANVGELKVLLGEGDSFDAARYVVSQLSGLLEVHGGKLWVIGAVGSYEIYMKILAQFPSLEKDWDLHMLPITSSVPSNGGLYSKPSLMGSFVPFGGFFSNPSEIKSIFSSTNQSPRCDLCNEKYEQEVSVILKGGPTASVADQFSASLSPWLQMAECETSKSMDVVKAQDDGTVLNAKLVGLQRKWNDICQRLHPNRQFQSDISLTKPQIHCTEGFQLVAADRKGSSSKESSSNESGSSNLIPSLPKDLQKVSPLKQTIASPVASEAENSNCQPRQLEEASKSRLLTYPVCSLSVQHNDTSPSSVTSVTTDLGLGTLYTGGGLETGKLKLEEHKNRLNCFSGSITQFDQVSENASNLASPSSCSIPELGGRVDPKDFKSLWRSLAEKVGWQGEAICTVSQTISRCKTGNGRMRGSNHRGDIWLSFLGRDKVGKKRTAAALAEIMFGSRENLICVDLSSEDGMSCSNTIFDSRELNSCNMKFRGKTVVDYIAEELSRKPRSVMLLENVERTDFMAQHSLSQAIRTGKFPDSHGREVGISNSIFVTTSNTTKDNKVVVSGKEHVKFSEERILGAKGLQMQVSVGCVAGDGTKTKGANVSVIWKESLKSMPADKRKLIDMNESADQDTALEIPKRARKASKSFLDLNLPVADVEDDDYRNCDSDSNSENSEVWLEDFFAQVDEKVVFEPFDFDALAEEVLKEIDQSFKKTVGSEVMLQIDEEVMVEILAAAWLSERRKALEDWVERVLKRSFLEAHQRFHLTSQSVVKLVACDGLSTEEQAPGVCLPARITIN